MASVNKHNWKECDEKILLENVVLVDKSFPKGSKVLKDFGGKWFLVSSKMRQHGINVSSDACKKRFFKIKSREKIKNENGKEVVTLLGTEFTQVDSNDTSYDQMQEDVKAIIRANNSDFDKEIKDLRNRYTDLRVRFHKLNRLVENLYINLNIGLPQ